MVLEGYVETQRGTKTNDTKGGTDFEENGEGSEVGAPTREDFKDTVSALGHLRQLPSLLNSQIFFSIYTLEDDSPFKITDVMGTYVWDLREKSRNVGICVEVGDLCNFSPYFGQSRIEWEAMVKIHSFQV